MYRLTLTETQADVLMQALDLFFRCHMGQFEEVADLVPGRGHDRHREVRAALRVAKSLALPELGGAYHSIGSPAVSDAARVARDVHDTIRGFLAWERNPKGGIQVSFDRVEAIGPEPLPTFGREVES